MTPTNTTQTEVRKNTKIEKFIADTTAPKDYVWSVQGAYLTRGAKATLSGTTVVIFCPLGGHVTGSLIVPFNEKWHADPEAALKEHTNRLIVEVVRGKEMIMNEIGPDVTHIQVPTIF